MPIRRAPPRWVKRSNPSGGDLRIGMQLEPRSRNPVALLVHPRADHPHDADRAVILDSVDDPVLPVTDDHFAEPREVAGAPAAEGSPAQLRRVPQLAQRLDDELAGGSAQATQILERVVGQ